MRFEGILPAVTTPFAADGDVDLDALRGERRRRCSTPACTASSATGTMGEAGASRARSAATWSPRSSGPPTAACR